MSSSYDQLAQELATIKRRLDARQTPQLTNSAIDDGAVVVTDRDERESAFIGKQFDGSFGVVPILGPTPPTPAPLAITPVINGFDIEVTGLWDPELDDTGRPIFAPQDFKLYEVHAAADPNLSALFFSTLIGEVSSARGGHVITVAAPDTDFYFRVVARTVPGLASAPSAVVGPFRTLKATEADLDIDLTGLEAPPPDVYTDTFADWTDVYPAGWAAWQQAPIKETELARSSANAPRWPVAAAGTQAGMVATQAGALDDLPVGLEYVVVEVDFIPVSGSLVGAGVVLDWDGLTVDKREILHLATEVPTYQLGKVHRVSKVLRRPVNAGGAQAGWTAYLAANHADLGGATKDIIFDRVTFRPATAEEVSAYRVSAFAAENIDGRIITGALFRTAASGPRLEADQILSTSGGTQRRVGALRFYSGNGNSFAEIAAESRLNADGSTLQGSAFHIRGVDANVLAPRIDLNVEEAGAGGYERVARFYSDRFLFNDKPLPRGYVTSVQVAEGAGAGPNVYWELARTADVTTTAQRIHLITLQMNVYTAGVAQEVFYALIRYDAVTGAATQTQFRQMRFQTTNDQWGVDFKFVDFAPVGSFRYQLEARSNSGGVRAYKAFGEAPLLVTDIGGI